MRAPAAKGQPICTKTSKVRLLRVVAHRPRHAPAPAAVPMTDLGLTGSQLAAWERGAAQAAVDCAAAPTPTTISVSIDVGGGQRRHIDWCLEHQFPVDRCGCEPATPADIDVELDTVAELLSATRHQLDLYIDATAAIIDVPTGDRV